MPKNVYYRIAEAIVKNEKVSMSEFHDELNARNGFLIPYEFDRYATDIETCLWIAKDKNYFNENGSYNYAKAVKRFLQVDRKGMLEFNFLSSEIEFARRVEEEGRLKCFIDENGTVKHEILTFDGYPGIVEAVDYRCLPKDIHLIVGFSGHLLSGIHAAEAFIIHRARYKNESGEKVKFANIGLWDSHGNTGQSGNECSLWYGSEAESYARCAMALGIPKVLVEECIVGKPTDTTTALNILSLKDIIKKKLANVSGTINVVLITYSAYEKRVATEFAFGLDKLGLGEKVKLYIGDVEPAKNKITPYDREDCVFMDVVQNVRTHTTRRYGIERYDLGLEYPEELKSFASIAINYNYPDAVAEKTGLDETILSALKIYRQGYNSFYGLENDRKIDYLMLQAIDAKKKELVDKGYISAYAAKAGHRMFVAAWEHEIHFPE